MLNFNQLKSLKEVGTPEINFAITKLPDRDAVVVGNSAGQLIEFDLSVDKPQPRPFQTAHTSYVTGVVSSQGGLVSGSYDRQLIWWDPLERTVLREIAAHDKWIRQIASNPDGSLIASVGDDMHCKVWDAVTGELRFILDDHATITPQHYPSMLFTVAFSPDGRLLATGDKVGHVAIWDVVEGRKVGAVESPGMYTWDPRARRHSIGGVRSVAFSRDGQTLAVGGIGVIGNVDHLDGPARVELFDWRNSLSIAELTDTAMKGLVEQLWFSPGDTHLVTAGGDNNGFITIYDLATRKVAKQEKAHQHLHGLAVDEASGKLYSAHHGRVVTWNIQDDQPQST